MAEQRLNCWEYMQCGRELDGSKIRELGICPAAVDKAADRINHGTNGGRYCWAITGTLCQGEVQGSFARKLGNCLQCDFYQHVERQEDRTFVLLVHMP